MTYEFLQPGLRSVAESVRVFFADDRGVTKIRAEETFDPQVSFKPTLTGRIPGGILCIEVSETFFPASLNALVSDCLAHGLPVQVFVACPSSSTGKIDEAAIRRASSLGVGCLLVTNGRVEVIREAQDLSLFIDDSKKKSFPGKYRHSVAEAFVTYRNGNPAKGLATVCDAIESIVRTVAIRARTSGRIPAARKLNLATGPLQRVIDLLVENQILPKILLARCLAMTEYRNASSHAPKTTRELVRRNARLKTHFFTALQLLEDLIPATKRVRL